MFESFVSISFLEGLRSREREMTCVSSLHCSLSPFHRETHSHLDDSSLSLSLCCLGRGLAVALSLGSLYHIVGHFNFDATLKNTLHVTEYQKLVSLLTTSQAAEDGIASQASEANAQIAGEVSLDTNTMSGAGASELEQTADRDKKTQTSSPLSASLDMPLSIAEKKRLYALHDAKVSALFDSQSPAFDSLIMAASSPPYDPYALLLPLLPFLKPSRQIAIFSPYKECLSLAFEKARANRSLINIQLTESLCRQYQVAHHQDAVQALVHGCTGAQAYDERERERKRPFVAGMSSLFPFFV